MIDVIFSLVARVIKLVDVYTVLDVLLLGCDWYDMCFHAVVGCSNGAMYQRISRRVVMCVSLPYRQ